jgi:hypothetical protein
MEIELASQHQESVNDPIEFLSAQGPIPSWSGSAEPVYDDDHHLRPHFFGILSARWIKPATARHQSPDDD